MTQPPPIQPSHQPDQLVKLTTLMLALILAGSGIYLLSAGKSSAPSLSPNAIAQESIIPYSSSDPTANWKKFLHQKYGYEIMFPESMEINAIGAGDIPHDSDKVQIGTTGQRFV